MSLNPNVATTQQTASAYGSGAVTRRVSNFLRETVTEGMQAYADSDSTSATEQNTLLSAANMEKVQNSRLQDLKRAVYSSISLSKYAAQFNPETAVTLLLQTARDTTSFIDSLEIAAGALSDTPVASKFSDMLGYARGLQQMIFSQMRSLFGGGPSEDQLLNMVQQGTLDENFIKDALADRKSAMRAQSLNISNPAASPFATGQANRQ
jgi:hypothetical protein